MGRQGRVQSPAGRPEGCALPSFTRMRASRKVAVHMAVRIPVVAFVATLLAALLVAVPSPSDAAAVRGAQAGPIDTTAELSGTYVSEDAPRAYIARADDYADALAGSPLAAADGAPILFVEGDTVSEAVLAELARIAPDEVVILGGIAAVSEAAEEQIAQAGHTTRRLAGDNRFETAALVAESVFDDPTSAGVATGAAFADALAGVAHIAGRQGPILLAERDRLPFATEQWLGAHTRSLERLYLYGGPAALGEGIETTLRAVFG